MEKKYTDYSLIILISILCAVGIWAIYSSSVFFAARTTGDGYYYLKKELFFLILGFITLFFFKNLDYHRYWNWVYPILFISLFALILTFIPKIGHSAYGAQRWLNLPGIKVQPSEFAKFAVILFVAYSMAKKKEIMKDFKKGFLPTIGISFFVVALILAQRDLGTTFTLASIVMMMVFIGGTKAKYLLGCTLPLLPIFYLAIYRVEYRLNRIKAFLDPWADQRGTGHQIIQSYVAFNSGGFWGVGLGQGKAKLGYLPAAHTDFILAAIAQELGFVGVFLIIAFFAIFFYYGIKIALNAKDLFGSYLAIGTTLLISFQALINFGVVMGLLPTKGLTLPFISYGGSSLLITMAMVGILLNIASQTRVSSQ